MPPTPHFQKELTPLDRQTDRHTYPYGHLYIRVHTVTDVTPTFFQSSRAGLAYMHSYRKTKGLSELFLSLEKICYSDSIIPYEPALRHVTHGSIVVSIVISLTNMGCNAYGMFGPAKEQFDSYLIPVSPHAPGEYFTPSKQDGKGTTSAKYANGR